MALSIRQCNNSQKNEMRKLKSGNSIYDGNLYKLGREKRKGMKDLGIDVVEFVKII